jgi:hypothetical protein
MRSNTDDRNRQLSYFKHFVVQRHKQCAQRFRLQIVQFDDRDTAQMTFRQQPARDGDRSVVQEPLRTRNKVLQCKKTRRNIRESKRGKKDRERRDEWPGPDR